jgi:mannose-6-phosphate isomerase-like protein (cupin superfamily)
VWSLGSRFTIKAPAGITEERFALVEAVALQATELPLHIHYREDEAWYILDGKMTKIVKEKVNQASVS